ncbi:MAG: Asp-tRNA(Asn)/Glu-tRNA(Gln) amidotransferase subunit GatB [Gammaproteobacteria bacterium]|nr:Asp-tRNA(Asn)/Glu-tRNA(Gln) amidotransferase subunit GatB [Gammaproteobacteria bacterium]
MTTPTWEIVIGLEVHVQLQTKSKIFSGASTAYGAEPNTQACDVSIALPGVLPVMNEEAARLAIKFGLSIDAHINQRSIFARKNYFYPDLPKGYQISQFELPIVGAGKMEIETEKGTKVIGITRAHLEEDAGKSVHEGFHRSSGIDLNRAGTPLLEIVSEPDMRSAAEAVAYLRKLHTLVRYLEISDGNMQEGSFRCDANVSVRPKGQEAFGTRAEIKNINSFRFVEKAINFEVERQIDLIEDGGEVVQETRLYDSEKDETRSMRSKEEAHDYRYFPDPDLPAMILEDSFIESIRRSLPELPEQRKIRFVDEHGLSPMDADKLTSEKETADYFESVCEQTNAEPKMAANWVLGELTAALNNASLPIADSPMRSAALASLLNRISDNTISGKIAKEIFSLLWESHDSVDKIIQDKGLKQITDSAEIESIVDNILKTNADQVAQYEGGNQKVFGFFVGQVMKQTGGKANPKQVNEILRNKLD